MGDLAEAGHAAGQLTLLQGLQVTSVQTIHGASSHTPVEVVHSLSLQQRMAFRYQVPKREALSLLYHKHMHAHTYTHIHCIH